MTSTNTYTYVSLLAILFFGVVTLQVARAEVTLVPSQSSINFDDVSVGSELQKEITLLLIDNSASSSVTQSPSETVQDAPRSSRGSSSGGGGGGGGKSSTRSSNASEVSTAATAPILSTLASGSRGDEVLRLQAFLVAKGYLSADSITGLFGSATEVALKRYQCSKQIICSGKTSDGYGVLGPKTRTAINVEMGSGAKSETRANTSTQTMVSPYMPFNTVLARGSEGSEVLRLQNFLLSKGFLSAGDATGFYGTLTESAVKRYQCAKQILCSGGASDGYGNLGPKTRAAINAELSRGGGVSVSMPSNREQILLQIQDLLAKIALLQKQLEALQRR